MNRLFFRRIWLNFQALAWPIASYWAAIVVGLLAFSAVLFIDQRSEPKDPIVYSLVAALWVIVVGSVAFGQALALLKFRTFWVISAAVAAWVASFTLFIGSVLVQESSGNPTFVQVALVLGMILSPFLVSAGHWSLTTHMGVLATFTPTLFYVGAIIGIAEMKGDADIWRAGDKWGFWSTSTIFILGIGLMLMLVFLAARELHRLHHWRYGEGGPELASGAPKPGLRLGRGNAGFGGLVALFALGVFLTISSALVAPFLWRTGGDGNDNTDAPPTEQPATETPNETQESVKEALRRFGRAGEEAARSFILLVLLVVLTILALIVFGPPLRRMVLLQYLRRPFWPVAPTRRIQQHWRLVEIALGDRGIYRDPGDSATSLANRAAGSLDLIDPEALHRCAAVVDRVSYGLGLEPQDTMYARRTAEMTYQSVWDELSEFEKWRAMYRFL